MSFTFNWTQTHASLSHAATLNDLKDIDNFDRVIKAMNRMNTHFQGPITRHIHTHYFFQVPGVDYRAHKQIADTISTYANYEPNTINGIVCATAKSRSCECAFCLPTVFELHDAFQKSTLHSACAHRTRQYVC